MQSQGKQAAYTEMLAAKEAAGERVVKKWKVRSDKGKTRAKGRKKTATESRGHVQDNVMRVEQPEGVMMMMMTTRGLGHR